MPFLFAKILRYLYPIPSYVMKIRYLILLFFLPLLAKAQETRTLWQGHYSYLKISDIDFSQGKVFAASENAFFIYDTATRDIEKKSTIHGLSGEDITDLHISEAFNKVILGYETGLMEIYDLSTENVVTVIDIKDKQTLPPNSKQVNDIMEYAGFLYIATNFGISLYNLERLEFDDTYFIGPGGTAIQVRETEIFETFIYAATSEGILRAPIDNPNLIDFSQWELVVAGDWKEIDTFNNALYALDASNNLNGVTSNSVSQIRNFSQSVFEMRSSGQFLLVSSAEEILLLSDNLLTGITIGGFTGFPDAAFNMALVVGQRVYIGTNQYGVLETNTQNQDMVSEIHPSGPLLNRAFALGGSADDIWVAHGDYTQFYNPYPLDELGVSHFTENSWKNLPYDNIFEAKSLVYITANPKEPEQVLISSFFSGLVEIESGVPTVLYNQTNSSLESLDIGDPTYVDIRISGAYFDNLDNLWVLNSRIDEGLKQRTPSGDWRSYDLSEVAPVAADNLGLKEMVVDRNQFKFISSERHGVIGFFENNGSPLVKSISGPEAKFASNDVRALALDANNVLWIGTIRGLRLMYNTNDFFSNDTKTVEPVIILDEGVPSELLFDRFINDIKVDGSNNKWIATADSGAYYVSSSGNETLHHFTSQNSPLPSNTIQDIFIDGISGRVYFATPRGLVSFLGNAVLPETSLDRVEVYPNPVRPGYTGMVTIRGLVSGANIKITDIEGNLVHETSSQGGSVQWDLMAFGKYKVASGVYMVLISNEDGTDTAVSKIMVIR